jgi:hypothetical protein
MCVLFLSAVVAASILASATGNVAGTSTVAEDILVADTSEELSVKTVPGNNQFILLDRAHGNRPAHRGVKDSPDEDVEVAITCDMDRKLVTAGLRKAGSRGAGQMTIQYHTDAPWSAEDALCIQDLRRQ